MIPLRLVGHLSPLVCVSPSKHSRKETVSLDPHQQQQDRLGVSDRVVGIGKSESSSGRKEAGLVLMDAGAGAGGDADVVALVLGA